MQQSINKKVEDIESIFNFCRIINHKKDISKYVEEPLISVCEYLYDLNVLTTMTSANMKNGNKTAYVILNYSSLSEYNKEVLLKELNKNPSGFRIGVFSIVQSGDEIEIKMPINKDTKVQEINDFFMSIFQKLKIQEINSFLDGDTYMKNIYSLDEIIGLYLRVKMDIMTYGKAQNSSEVDNFLKSIGFKKVSAKDFAGGMHAKFCKYLYSFNSEFIIPDGMIYEALLKNKNNLFNSKVMLKENVNIEEVLNSINPLFQKNFGEQLFYNEEDERFYLNQELLEKHKNYLKEKEDSKEKAPVKTLKAKQNKDRK